VSTSFNVSDLSPFFGLEESRMTLFEGGGWYAHVSVIDHIDHIAGLANHSYRTNHT
jgi:hypothetical protein